MHVSFADPYCPAGRARGDRRPGRAGALADGGTLVVIEGPRFSTRAESHWYAAHGWSIVGMTGHPEAVLARELALCYTTIALVTDIDAGVDEGEGVTQEEVFRVFAANVVRLRDLLMRSSKRSRPSATAPARTPSTITRSRSSCPDAAPGGMAAAARLTLSRWRPPSPPTG